MQRRYIASGLCATLQREGRSVDHASRIEEIMAGGRWCAYSGCLFEAVTFVRKVEKRMRTVRCPSRPVVGTGGFLLGAEETEVSHPTSTGDLSSPATLSLLPAHALVLGGMPSPAAPTMMELLTSADEEIPFAAVQPVAVAKCDSDLVAHAEEKASEGHRRSGAALGHHIREDDFDLPPTAGLTVVPGALPHSRVVFGVHECDLAGPERNLSYPVPRRML